MSFNLHSPWTDWAKAINWNVAQAEFGRVAQRIADGSASEKDIARMADAAIDIPMATRIAAQYAAHHTEVQGRLGGTAKFANTAEWTDPGARQAFSAAMSREANILVPTAGIGDKPLWMSTKVGSLMGQFKSFDAAVYEKTLIAGLQQRDAKTLSGAMSMIALGMLSYKLYSIASGRETSDDPREWIKEGIDRAGFLGWIGELNKIASKTTSGSLDINRLYGAKAPLSRHRDNTIASEILGPAIGHVVDVGGAGLNAVTGNATAADVHKVRLGFPLQNLMGLRILLDKVEDGIANLFGMKPRAKPAVH